MSSLGSGLTVAGAVFCLSFTRLPYFQSLGIPGRDRRPGGAGGRTHPGARRADHRQPLRPVGTQTQSAAHGDGAGSARRSSAGPGRSSSRRWRWPLIGLLALPGYKTSYDVGPYMPDRRAIQRRLRRRRAPLLEGPAQSRTSDDRGRSRSAESDRHDPVGAGRQGRLPHDRHRPGAIHHPPVGHATRPHLDSVSDQRAEASVRSRTCGYQQDRANDLLKQVGEIDKTIGILRQQAALQQQSDAATHEQVEAFHQTVAVAQDLRDKIANFDDFFRPLRNYFYWEPHCFDIPICWALRSLFDALDGIDALTDQLANVTTSLDKLDSMQPKLLDADPTADRQPADQSRPDR